MKHNFIRKILSVILSCSVMALSTVTVSSEEYAAPDVLEIYQHKLELLNEKYGTDFHIATFSMTETEINDLMAEYLNMTDEEFEEYFLDLKEKSERFLKEEQSKNHVMYSGINSYSSLDELLRTDAEVNFCYAEAAEDKNTSYNTENSAVENVQTPSASPDIEEMQNYFYDSNYNNFWIDAYVNYSAGWGQYTSILAGGTAVVKYPAYKVDESKKIDYDVRSSYKKCDVICTYPCYYYISENMVSGSLQYKKITFTAGKGDIYAF